MAEKSNKAKLEDVKRALLALNVDCEVEDDGQNPVLRIMSECGSLFALHVNLDGPVLRTIDHHHSPVDRTYLLGIPPYMEPRPR